MRPGPALLLLGLGLGLGHLPPPAGRRGTLAWPSGALRSAPGSGQRGSFARLRPQPRAAREGGVLWSGAPAPRRADPALQLQRRVRALPRVRRPSWSPAWTSSPRVPGPGRARPTPRSVQPDGRRSRCRVSAPEREGLKAANSSGSRSTAPSQSCQLADCVIHRVQIRRDKDPVPFIWMKDSSINASVQYDCRMNVYIVYKWQIFPVGSVNHLPDWTRPLHIQLQANLPLLRIPKFTLQQGVYVFNFSMTINKRDGKVLSATDAVYVQVSGHPLKAVLLGGADVTVNFTDELILDGSKSSDPDADRPLEGLVFSWYCTTNLSNYHLDQITVFSKEVCHPEQTSLNWLQASSPKLTLAPETLKGDRVYYFRMMVKKGSKSAFSDKRVRVLPGPLPTAHISCTENCGQSLVVSDRFSLFLNCKDCVSRDFYNWSILSSAGDEVLFDWTRQTVTGRNSAYLLVKAFAFSHFSEARFWVSVSLTSWKGMTMVFRYGFIINHGPQVGKCQVNPARGFAVVTQFVVQCSNFQDKDIPLTYKVIVSDVESVGEISSVEENTMGTTLYLGTGSTAPPSLLPAGVPANHYALKFYAQVYDSLGAFSQVTFYATVQAPTDKNPSKTVLDQLVHLTTGPTSLLSTLLQKQDMLPAGYLIYVVASVLNSMKTEPTLQGDKVNLQEELVKQSFKLPVNTLDEIGQVVMIITKLTQKGSEFTELAQQKVLEKLWQANQALQEYQRKDKNFRSEQIDIMSTGILMSLSNILHLIIQKGRVVEDPFKVVESLSDTILADKVPSNETTVLRTPTLNMYVERVEKWDVSQAFRNEECCRNCFHATLNASRVPGLPEKAPVSMMFYEFTDYPFPWLNAAENTSAGVIGFRMTGATEKGKVIEITPDVVDVYLVRKNLSSANFNLTVGPSKEREGSLKKTTGGFEFEVDIRRVREVLIHFVTEVTVLFKVFVYAGSQGAPADVVAVYIMPHDVPPVVDHSWSDLSDAACAVREARVVCLPPPVLQIIAQRSHSPKCTISMVLQAPHFVLEPSDKLVRISLFSVNCMDMYGIQRDWKEDTCVLGEKTTWDTVHCVCKSAVRTRRQLGALKLAYHRLHTHFVTARVIVIPNPVDLRLTVIGNVSQNPVTLFTVLFIILLYTVLAFWALHRDEMDQFLRDHVIILPDNDPYDSMCYLITVFTGSRCGAGTRANVFVQLNGTKSKSDVHCLSHPHFKTLYRGSINTFLLTTKSDLGDIHSIRVWHNNEGRAPSWYLNRIKVENLFNRQIWLFICRKWLSVDTTLEETFPVTLPDEPLKRKDYFLIDMTRRLGKNHLWFSVFTNIVSKSFNRLQRLSCCLAMLLSSLVCNIMFFNLNVKEQSKEGRYIRSMMIGIESVIITIPVHLLITFFFTYSQKRPQVSPDEVAPQKHPLLSEESGYWKERLDKWHAYETSKGHTTEKSGTKRTVRARQTPVARGAPTIKKPTSRNSRVKPGPSKPFVRVTFKEEQQSVSEETSSSDIHKTNTNASNRNREDDQAVPSQQESPQHLNKKPQFTLPSWCVYVAWFLVFATCSMSSFFIIFYGLTYGYEKSVEWLFASVCSFCQSVFLVQPCKIILLSAAKTSKPKYCKNLSWSTKHGYIEIRLRELIVPPKEMQTFHQHILNLQGSRMYQPLTEDEIRIFRRKKRIRRRAILFLSYLLTHFIFLALLLLLIALLRHTDSFYYNQFIRDQFSVDLAAVTKLQDIYRWLDGVLLPLFHNDLNPTFLIDSSSKILGLPLLRQVRAKAGERVCLPSENFVENSISKEIHCRPKYGTDPEDTKNYSSFWNAVSKRETDNVANGFTYKPREKKWVYYSYGLLNTYGSGGYAFYFFPEQQQFNSTLRLKELQGGKWLDEKTWAVILELTTFNPDINLFCSISVLFEVSQLGVVNSSISTHSFPLADFNRKTSAEIYLYVAILIFFLAYVVDEGYVILQEGASYMKSVYNLLNFALKCIFTLLIMLFVSKHFLATGVIQFYLSSPEDFIPFHAVSQIDHTMRIILAFLLFLTILKTLRYSRVFYDVRLAQRAIQAALPGICHMAFVVSVYFFVYMAFGYLVFGQHEWHYSNMVHATQTIFSYCVSAFQDTEFSSNRVLGVLFLSSFMLVMICILINLFQAVILSAYEEMKQPVYEEPSDEVEAMTYLCRKLRAAFTFLTPQSKHKDESEFLATMLYGQPEKNSHRYLGLKTRNINGKKMVYLVV
ncbi:polycystin family receptor for egg jelly [Urocitellus parryii]